MSTEQELEEIYLRLYEESIRQAQELIQKGIQPIATLIREKKRTEKALDELQNKYDNLAREHAKCFKTDIQAEFKRQRTWLLRFCFMLRNENRLLAGRDFVQLYPKYEPDWESRYCDLRNCIQHALHVAYINKLLIGHEVPNMKGLYYGLPDFFHQDGSLKNEYAFYKR